MIAYLLILIHLLICLFVYLGMRAGLMKSGTFVLAFVILVPVWGILCLIFLEARLRGKQEVREEVGIEKMKINDEIYRSILVDEDNARDLVVPLEEALLINRPKERRDLMMEIMYSGAGQYVTQLKDARMNDDTEVVHYATTALVEIQKEYDLKFQKLDMEYRENPDREGLVQEYLDLLEDYIGSGVLEGNMLDVQERRYSELLGRVLETETGTRPLYEKKVRVDLRLKKYAKAHENIKKILAGWPEDEIGYLLLIQYYAAVGDRAGIDRVLKEVNDRQIYLSAEGRMAVKFWQAEKAD